MSIPQAIKKIVAYALSQLPININQKTPHESTYTTETVSELYNIEELPEDKFLISLNFIDRYQ